VEEPAPAEPAPAPAPKEDPAPAPAKAGIASSPRSFLGALVDGHIVVSLTFLAAAAVVAASFCVSKQEPPPPPPLPAAVPVEKRSDLPRVDALTVVLCLVSGWVNAVAILQMGGIVAAQTGNASHAGHLVGVDGARFATLMLAYFCGAAVTGFRKSNGENPLIGKASPALMASAIAVAGGALIHWASGNSLVALPILAFSQGIQNGVTSMFSSMPLRTTHMTGTLTDTGAACGAWLRSKFYSDAQTMPASKLSMLLATLVAFSVGGVLAKMACDRMGSLAALPPAAVLAALASGALPLGHLPSIRRLEPVVSHAPLRLPPTADS